MRRAQINEHLFPGTITNLRELANLRGEGVARKDQRCLPVF